MLRFVDSSLPERIEPIPGLLFLCCELPVGPNYDKGAETASCGFGLAMGFPLASARCATRCPCWWKTQVWEPHTAA